jgi:hypothetical protein
MSSFSNAHLVEMLASRPMGGWLKQTAIDFAACRERLEPAKQARWDAAAREFVRRRLASQSHVSDHAIAADYDRLGESAAFWRHNHSLFAAWQFDQLVRLASSVGWTQPIGYLSLERFGIKTALGYPSAEREDSEMARRTFKVGDRVEGGKPGTEDFDTGRIVEINRRAKVATVTWDSFQTTHAPIDILRHHKP